VPNSSLLTGTSSLTNIWLEEHLTHLSRQTQCPSGRKFGIERPCVDGGPATHLKRQSGPNLIESVCNPENISITI